MLSIVLQGWFVPETNEKLNSTAEKWCEKRKEWVPAPELVRKVAPKGVAVRHKKGYRHSGQAEPL